MKKQNLWQNLRNRFFIFFNLTKTYERPSKKEQFTQEENQAEKKNTILHTVKATVLPEKENISLDEFSGFTRTKIRIEEVYKGNLTKNRIITICEPYYEGYYAGEKCMLVYENYEPLIIGKSYTFLLAYENKEPMVISDADLACENIHDYKEIYHKAG
ncbi:MAG: hypothetical protein E7231_07525 [Cellulosilyticum sp.]|nr:hypothetical protein [Cellulosilyticum sp.]